MPGAAAQPQESSEPATRQSSKAPIPATPGQGSRISGSARPYCRLRQQMAMTAAVLLPGMLAATQVLSTA